MKRPYSLKKSDTVALVATARKISLEELQPAVQVLESWGLKCLFPKYLFNQSNQFSGTDQERANDLMQMYLSPDVDAVLCVRGGYGTARILPYLDIEQLKKNKPKWLIGYSDVTVLHSLFNTHLETQSLHATMPINFSQYIMEDKALKSLKNILFAEEHQTTNYVIPHHSLNRQGEVKSEIVGGNLSVLFSLRGTPYDLDYKGKILFIEDLDEYLYHIDRMLTNFSLGGILKDIAGLIIGGMNNMNDNAIAYGKTAYEIIQEHTLAFDYPVAFGFPAGHIHDNYALRMGAEVVLKVQEDQTQLNFLE